jgi:hypothetical protein
MEKVPPLQSYFPHATAKCKEVGAAFFHCFSENSEKENSDDTRAGDRGLLKCKKERLAYEECMNASMKGVDPKRYRVRLMHTVFENIISYPLMV